MPLFSMAEEHTCKKIVPQYTLSEFMNINYLQIHLIHACTSKVEILDSCMGG